MEASLVELPVYDLFAREAKQAYGYTPPTEVSCTEGLALAVEDGDQRAVGHGLRVRSYSAREYPGVEAKDRFLLAGEET